MRARFNPTGLTINCQNEDINQSRLEYIVNMYNSPKLIIEKREEVLNSGRYEEPGFHIECTPSDSNFETCKEINIFLDKKRWNQIFFEYDPEAMGGCFISRSKYDRIDICYFNPDANPIFSRNIKF